MRVGLSGTGRIGRLVLRKVFSQPSINLDVSVINTTTSTHTLAHLLQYDTVHGKWDASMEIDGESLIINGRRVSIVSERDPGRLPWREYGVELAIDATGKFTDRAGLEKHLAAGARKALLTAPGQGMDATIVMGVNEETYDPERHHLVSAASCTTNCLAPVLHILDRAFGVERGWMTTVHAYTNDQKHLDNPHKDLRRARACTSSIVPTSTGVLKALRGVLPHLAPRVKGISLRVPTQDVSLMDLVADLKAPAQADEVRAAFRAASAGEMGAYVEYNELPLVSADYIGNEKSAVIDGLSLMTQDHQVKILAWYDNEWGYACRVADLARHMSNAEQETERGGERCLIKTV